MALSTAQVEQFRTSGWLAPIDVLTPAEATGLAAAFAAAEAEHPAHLHATNRNNAHLTFPFLAELAVHPIIVEAVRCLVGDDISLWSSVLFVKEPDSTAFVSWHQDATYMALEPDNFVTAWLALTPSTVESGCVTVLPGTHTERARHRDTFSPDNILTRGQEVDVSDTSHQVHLELQPGQMSLHHPWLLHGSQPNRSTGRRIGIAMQSYFGNDVRPTYGEHHIVHVRGAQAPSDFLTVPLPTETCTDANLRIRAAANEAIADVLYKGAEERRSL